MPDIILCISLNHKAHANEAKARGLDSYLRCLQKTLIVPVCAAEISNLVKDVSVPNAPGYVLGYTVGNDVSSRAWQMPDTSSDRYCFAKSFDVLCPIGPKIVAASQIPDHTACRL